MFLISDQTFDPVPSEDGLDLGTGNRRKFGYIQIWKIWEVEGSPADDVLDWRRVGVKNSLNFE